MLLLIAVCFYCSPAVECVLNVRRIMWLLSEQWLQPAIQKLFWWFCVLWLWRDCTSRYMMLQNETEMYNLGLGGNARCVNFLEPFLVRLLGMFVHRCAWHNIRWNAVQSSTPKTVLYSHHSFDICQQIYCSCSLYVYVPESLYKSKDVPVHAVTACRGSRGIAPLVFNVTAVWSLVASFFAWPVCTQGKSMQYQLCPFSRRLDGLQTRCGCPEEQNVPWLLLQIRSQMVHLME